MWTCPKCGAKVDAGFDVCWQCGVSIDGVEDPTFVTADLTPAIEDPDVSELGAGQAGLSEIAGDPLADLVECYLAHDYLEAKFIADQLNELGILAFADSMDLHESLGAMNASPRVRVRSDFLEPARQWLEEYERKRNEPAEASSVLDD